MKEPSASHASKMKHIITQQRLNLLVGQATCIGGAIRDPL